VVPSTFGFGSVSFAEPDLGDNTKIGEVLTAMIYSYFI
jgi:hypothetical protein